MIKWVCGCMNIFILFSTLFISLQYFEIKLVRCPIQLLGFTEIDSLSSVRFFTVFIKSSWCVLFHRWPTRGRPRTIQWWCMCVCVCVCVCVLGTQLCPTLWDPMDCSPLGSSVHGILQARILEWVAILFSRDLSDPGIELSLLRCRWILYCLSHQGAIRT